MGKYIKSLVLYEPNKLKIEKRSVPIPELSEVLIRVKAASICHTDFVVISGQYSRMKYPTVPGHEFSGIVEDYGSSVKSIEKGDRVAVLGYFYCGICLACKKGRYVGCKNIKGIPMDVDGAYQQAVAVPENSVYPFSDGLNFEEAALTEPAANGYAAAERGGISQGETVVVIGPGPIGLLALQAAALKLHGSLIMLGTRRERLELAARLGATDTVNVRERDPYEAIMDITEGDGADVVLFCGGGLDAWELSSKILKSFGRIVVEALPKPYSAKWPVHVSDFTEKTISYLGVSGYSPGQFAQALELIERGIIKVAPLITHRFPLEEYKEAFETVDKRKNGAIKVIIKPNN